MEINAILPPFPEFICDSEIHTLGTRWKKWCRKFDRLLLAMNVTDPKCQLAMLLHYAGDAVSDIFDDLQMVDGEYTSAIAALNKHFSLSQNTEYETYVFRRLQQEPEETLDQYYTKLRKMAQTCEFTDTEREIKSQIIIGCKSTQLRKHALQTKSLTLEDLLIYGKTIESSEHQLREMESSSKNINALRTPQKKWQPSRDTKRKPLTHNNGDRDTAKTCIYCGDKWHTDGLKTCKAKGQKCTSCGKRNHFSSVCRSKTGNTNSTKKGKNSVNQIQTQQHDTDNDSEQEYVFANRNIAKQAKQQKSSVQLTIFQKKIDFLIDSGATVNILSQKDFKNIESHLELQKTNTKIFPYESTTPINILGTVTAQIEHNNKHCSVKFYVTGGNGASLLGQDTLLNLGIVHIVHTLLPENTDQLLVKHKRLFEGIGKHNGVKVALHIDNTVTPRALKHRRIPFHLRKKVETELNELERKGIIEKVSGTEPTPWISPIVVVPKKDPDAVRICVDMRLANTAIQRERHLTPTIDDIIYDLNGAKVFSKLDLIKGYHQLELTTESRYITTFSTHRGLYRYTRLNFGISSAAEIFQNEINKTLQGITGVINVSDDILVYGKDQKQHDETLEKTLQRLEDKGLTLNRNKCVLSKSNLNFFGYIFSSEGIGIDPNKIKAIQTTKEPSNPTEVRSFLGMINFCMRFIPNLATLTKPLRELTQKNTKWSWSESQQEAFKNIKQQLIDTTTMSYFDQNEETEIWADASPTGLGALLVQRDANDNYKTIAFASRALSSPESRYSQIEREALALIWAVEHFHIYVYGKHVKLITDHKPLIYLFNNPVARLSTRLERWQLRMQPYNFSVVYMPGKDNPADYLSRHPLVRKPIKHVTETLADEYINFICDHTTPKAITLEEVKKATAEDHTLQTVIKQLRSGRWSNTVEGVNASYVTTLHKLQNELSTNDEGNILLKGTKIILPNTLRERAISIAHAGHQGMVKTKGLIREKIWFPDIDKMIEDKISRCLPCNAATDRKEQLPLQMSELPKGAWLKVHIDHKGPLPNGQYLLVLVDEYSRFPVVEIVNSTNALTNIVKLDHIFSTFGMPETVITDNGPPFNSCEFRKFAQYLGFTHRKITPVWPRANGEVERFNRTLMKTLQTAQVEKGNWKQHLNTFLRNYRAAPHMSTRVTPAELMFERKMRIQLPENHQNTGPNHLNVEENDKKAKHKMTQHHLKRNKMMKKLPQIGDTILIKQDQRDKLSTPYRPVPYRVTQTKGYMITAEGEGHKMTRNATRKIIPATKDLNIAETKQDRKKRTKRPSCRTT